MTAWKYRQTLSSRIRIWISSISNVNTKKSIPTSAFPVYLFKEMEETYGVEVAWLNVNTDSVNVDHEPKSPFEKEAATGLAAGKPYVEAVDANRYRFAGSIRLASQCLKCHLKRRTSTADRTAGLLISMPYFED